MAMSSNLVNTCMYMCIYIYIYFSMYIQKDRYTFSYTSLACYTVHSHIRDSKSENGSMAPRARIPDMLRSHSTPLVASGTTL